MREVFVFLNVQLHSDHINDRIASALTQLGQDLLTFIRANKVICQNTLHLLHAGFNDCVIIGGTILAQKELQNIDRDIGPFLDLFGQILPDDLAIKVLSQLFFDFLAGILHFSR